MSDLPSQIQQGLGEMRNNYRLYRYHQALEDDNKEEDGGRLLWDILLLAIIIVVIIARFA